MDLYICLDIMAFASLSLCTCTYVKPVKNARMAPSSPIFSWPRACGIRTKSARRSAFSTRAAAPRIPQQQSAYATSPAVSSNDVIPTRLCSTPRSGVWSMPGPMARSTSWKRCGGDWASPRSSRTNSRAANSTLPSNAPSLPWWPTAPVRPAPSSTVMSNGCVKTSVLKERIRSTCTISTAPWMCSKPIKTGLNKRSISAELIFYDTTSLHFEIDAMDQGHGDDELVEGSMAAGSKTYKAPRKRGMSKNGRADAPQIVVGLAVTREGLPVRHWVFPGNTVDVTTVAQVKDDLKGWKLSRCVFVGDAGMVSQENLERLSTSGGKYIVCRPMRRGDEVTHDVLQRPGRFQQVADNLRVKEVVVGEGERRRRYVVCHNPQEEKRQRAHRQQILRELEAELASLKHIRGESHSKRVCQLRASRRYGRYLRLTKGGLLRIDAAKRRAAEQLDGKFVVHSNDDSLSPADLALGYKQLQRVEEAWRSLKSGLRVRPVYHWAVHRIHAHVALSVLALLLERVI